MPEGPISAFEADECERKDRAYVLEKFLFFKMPKTNAGQFVTNRVFYGIIIYSPMV